MSLQIFAEKSGPYSMRNLAFSNLFDNSNVTCLTSPALYNPTINSSIPNSEFLILTHYKFYPEHTELSYGSVINWLITHSTVKQFQVILSCDYNSS